MFVNCVFILCSMEGRHAGVGTSVGLSGASLKPCGQHVGLPAFTGVFPTPLCLLFLGNQIATLRGLRLCHIQPFLITVCHQDTGT